MTPSRIGRTTEMLPGTRPSMLRASSPTATTLLSRTPTATTHGSLMTMPCPLRYTSTLAVPRSMPSRFANMMSPRARDPRAPRWSEQPAPSLHPFDRRAQRAELPFEIFVAAVQVEDLADARLTLGREPGEHQRGARADVERPDRGANQRRRAGDHDGG